MNTPTTGIYKIPGSKNRLKIVHSEHSDDPTSRDGQGVKRCFRKHRKYDLPNHLNFDHDPFDDEDRDETNDLEKLGKLYHIFMLDWYEHSGSVVSLAGTGMQCQRDTSSNCGFIAIPKEMCSYDATERSASNNKKKGKKIFYTEKEAKEVAEHSCEIYTMRMNGEVYGFQVQEPQLWNKVSDSSTKIEREDIDSCYGFYDLENLLNDVDSDVERPEQLEEWTA